MAKDGGHGEGGGGANSSATPHSRIARPISPGLKSTLSVAGGNSGIPTSSKLVSPSSSSSLSNGPAAASATAAARKGTAGEARSSIRLS